MNYLTHSFLVLTLTALASIGSAAAETDAGPAKLHQAVEYLVFKVDPAKVDEFIEADHRIWTMHLAKFPGFIEKEVWINELDPSEVTTVIYWNSLAEWHAIPSEGLVETEKAFEQVIGADSYELVGQYHKDHRWYKVREYVKDN